MRKLLRAFGFKVHVWKKIDPFQRECLHCHKVQLKYRTSYGIDGTEIKGGWMTMQHARRSL